MAKLKFAFYWAASCGGCEVAVLDIHEKILDVAALADIVFWPVALDFKYSDLRALQRGSVDVAFFNGALRNSEQVEIAHLMREKARVLVAFGTCAHLGGIPALANLTERESLLERVYVTTETTHNPLGTLPQPESRLPEGTLSLPRLLDSV
ncbi:MAG: F420-nonreducing hydrogenase, partial [Acetobacteraceae bacterium]|nr:F420-nonreducing hydrogenase [Acetobacteraceae bacterium]